MTTHYGKYLIMLSYAVIPAGSPSHSLHISCKSSPLLANPLQFHSVLPSNLPSFSFPILFPGVFPTSLMSFGSSWRNSYAMAFFLGVSKTVPWHSTDWCSCGKSGTVFLIADTFNEPVSNMACGNPGLTLTERFAQLGRVLVQRRFRYLGLNVVAQVLKRCTLTLEKIINGPVLCRSKTIRCRFFTTVLITFQIYEPGVPCQRSLLFYGFLWDRITLCSMRGGTDIHISCS